MLVTRLDAPTGSMVRRILTIRSSRRNTASGGGAIWTRAGLPPAPAARRKAIAGFPKSRGHRAPVFYRRSSTNGPSVFPGISDDRDGVYFGWYTGKSPDLSRRPDFRFQPGAVAVPSAFLQRDERSRPDYYWVGPLLDRGAAATLGNVYEPYLTLTTHFDLFAARLADGFTLAESAYAATPGLRGWTRSSAIRSTGPARRCRTWPTILR